jgi:HlyD family secretion protein
VLITLSVLPFIYIDISIKTSGITRPLSERTAVKSLISGIIDSLLFKEGEKVQKGSIILRLKDLTTKSKRTLNQFEIQQREQFIHDLTLLTSGADISSSTTQLISPLYKDQASRFLHQKADQEASLKKANKELELNTSLAKDKVISPKEFFDIQINQEKILSSYKAFTQEQFSTWQQDLAKYKIEISQYRQQMQQVNTDATYYDIKAPVTGVIQGINTRYTGGLLQANETLCNISPEEMIIGECYVQTKDIGLLKTDQVVRYQFEAFDYNYFGVLTGKIISIDNDFSAIDNKLVFKVRCSFDSIQLRLKNGFTGQVKKGLGFQANFVVARRSLWHLLFDKLDDWLNPNAPSTKTRLPIEQVN